MSLVKNLLDGVLELYKPDTPEVKLNAIYPCIPDADNKIVDIIKPDLEKGPWIAGGAALGWFLGQAVDSDIDVYCKDDAQYNELSNSLLFYKYELKTNTDNAATFKHDDSFISIQLIKHKRESVEHVLDEFDFTICQVATDGNRFVFGPSTLRDIKSKTINFNRFRLNCLNRLTKYLVYGYHLSVEAKGEIIMHKGHIVTDYSNIDCYDQT